MGASTLVKALPVAVDLGLYQGDDFAMTLTVTDDTGNPVDISAGTVAAQIRSSRGSPAVAGTFLASISGTNVVKLGLPATVSTTLPQLCVWDCKLTLGGTIYTLAGGRLELMTRVTQ
jgi:hypothetical protein